MVYFSFFGKKISVFILIVSIFFGIQAEGSPWADKKKEKFEPVVRVKNAAVGVFQEQAARFERLMDEGKRLLREEMDYEGATKKFEEARSLAKTRVQKADVAYYLSLVYYS
ncbi:MAG: hypothetical protein JXB26_04600, partial [Candidatus Aminicenantes bacterium]|nr:hypothetical protein [Candidatus Aminicenantes bacterium]